MFIAIVTSSTALTVPLAHAAWSPARMLAATEPDAMAAGPPSLPATPVDATRPHRYITAMTA